MASSPFARLQAGLRLLALLALATVPLAAQAGVPTVPDCLEGADFIANAARARDNGVRREAFLGRMADDFVVIRAFPPAFRWFVQDADDERFLLEAAARVYEQPRPPAQHHADFLAACLERLAA